VVAMLRIVVCLFALALAGGAAFAQPGDAPNGGAPELEAQWLERYDGHLVVATKPATIRELRTVVALADDVWTDRPRLGDVVIQVTPDKLALLDAQGIGYDVWIDDVQREVDRQMAEIRQVRGLRGAGFFDNYRTFGEIVTWMNDLQAQRPDLVSVFSIGQSHEGRDIWVMKITGPGDSSQRPAILWNGCQHAREWISPATVCYLADRFVNLYDTDARVAEIVNSTELLIVPVVNPDGYVYSWTSVRLWRKNRRDNGNGTFGVDLNRNWAFQWGGGSSSGSTSSDLYRGPSAFSEPETQAVRDYSLSLPNLEGHIDFHNFSQIILWPYTGTTSLPAEPDLSAFIAIGQEMSVEATGTNGVSYPSINGADFDIIGGDMSDWHYDQLGLFTMAIELRDQGQQGFLLSPDQIIPTGEEMFAAMLPFGEFVADGVRLSFPNGTPSTTGTDDATTFEVEVLQRIGALVPDSMFLNHRFATSGAFTQSALTPLGGSTYEASIPAGDCGDPVEFFVEAQSSTSGQVAEPSDGTGDLFEASVLQTTVLFEDDMESATGWAVDPDGTDGASTGVWERADPQGTGAQPENDHTPGGTVCWITGAAAGVSLGSNDIDGGETTLQSPLLDCTADGGDAFITYWRWYSNNQGGSPNEDAMPVEISNDDGMSWVLLESVTENAGAWVERSYRVADFVTPTDQVRVRFRASDFAGGSIVEAGVDDVRLDFRGCDAAGPADLTTTGAGDGDPGFGEPDGTVDLSDLLFFVNIWQNDLGSSPGSEADVTTTGAGEGNPAFGQPDGTVDLSDLLYYVGIWQAAL